MDDLLLLCLLHYVVCFNSLANLPLFLPLPRAIHSRFWMQPNLVIALFLGIGLSRMHSSLNHKVPAFIAKIGAIVSAVWLVYTQLTMHYNISNHSKKGNVISAYGNALLDTLPPNSILLSYTDINWNSVRYLQECEHKRPDVMHLNFQLMPYHWFQRQHDLYPGVTFPQLLQGVSTERGSKGFEQLMRRFVMQNMYTFPNNMYLDLHAVNESALGKDGYYNGFYITPHGMLWKIHEQKKMPSISKWNKEVKDVWKMYNTTFPLANSAQYPSGSWEFVARKIYYDGLYQRALHYLQYWVETSAKLGKDTTFDEIDDYLFGMRDIVHALDGIYHIAMPIYCISYPKKDIVKNLALSYMRYHGALAIADRQPDRDLPISKQLLSDIQDEAVRMSKEFIEINPKDKDIETFQKYVDAIENPTKEEEKPKKKAKKKRVKKRVELTEEEL
ncbi:hypothetical protein THRCLA_09991 [Thraustotheca clavata]|uniref:Uncharacterized protein n=1 Tax=Thraustotheca clavata TaxID=74557 RepID=A0A1V9YT55_9STRA|nr:hypothetical protein THRCLA_09991 [Thraustotheca clavata]